MRAAFFWVYIMCLCEIFPIAVWGQKKSLTKSELMASLAQITTSSCWVTLKNSSSCPALPGNDYYSVCSILSTFLFSSFSSVYTPHVYQGSVFNKTSSDSVGNNRILLNVENQTIPLFWPRIPAKYLKDGLWILLEGQRGRLIQLFKGNFKRECLRKSFVSAISSSSLQPGSIWYLR